MPRFDIDLSVCGRTGLCYFERPDLFAEGDDGYPYQVDDSPAGELSDQEANEVVMLCPTGALRLAQQDAPPRP